MKIFDNYKRKRIIKLLLLLFILLITLPFPVFHTEYYEGVRYNADHTENISAYFWSLRLNFLVFGDPVYGKIEITSDETTEEWQLLSDKKYQLDINFTDLGFSRYSPEINGGIFLHGMADERKHEILLKSDKDDWYLLFSKGKTLEDIILHFGSFYQDFPISELY